MRRGETLGLTLVLALAGLSSASAQFIVDHQPDLNGGPASDTELPISSLPFTWQALADSFQMPSDARVADVNWWGFYVDDNAPQAETMRLTFYSDDPADNSPGAVLFQENFTNPSRVETGRVIAIGGTPREYRFHLSLPNPVDLIAGIRYWFEVVQVGDSLSGFRWEFSRAETDGFARQNNLFPDWGPTTLTSDLAFQLAVPEPATAALILFGALGLRRRTTP